MTTERVRFEQALGLPHDLIDVSQRCGRTDVVYPILIALVERNRGAMPVAGPGPCGDVPRP